jgi:DNA processing protein
LADQVVVIEAGPGSGSLYTAGAAERLGRPLVALVGSAGADALIARGVAAGARDLEEILARLDGRPVAAAPTPELSAAAAGLYGHVDAKPRDVGELAARARLSLTTCAALAAELELRGLCIRASGGRYLRL